MKRTDIAPILSSYFTAKHAGSGAVPLCEDKWRESVAAAPIIPLSFVNLLSVTCLGFTPVI
jgi:hypothetical protein